MRGLVLTLAEDSMTRCRPPPPHQHHLGMIASDHQAKTITLGQAYRAGKLVAILGGEYLTDIERQILDTA